jgi:hypothetical protein
MNARWNRIAQVLRVGVVVGSLVGAFAVASPGAASASHRDRDGDHLRNRFERLASETSPTDKDTDNDGVNDPRDDEDCDGLINRAEQREGTDPLDADSDDDGDKDGDEDEDNDGVDDEDENDDDQGEDENDPDCDDEDDDDQGEDEDDGEDDD